MTPITPDAAEIEALVRQVVAISNPDRVVLFGSRATGTARPDSDVDLLVIKPFEGRSPVEAARIDARIERAFPLDLVVRRPEDVLRDDDPLLHDILLSGKTMYVRPG